MPVIKGFVFIGFSNSQQPLNNFFFALKPWQLFVVSSVLVFSQNFSRPSTQVQNKTSAHSACWAVFSLMPFSKAYTMYLLRSAGVRLATFFV